MITSWARQHRSLGTWLIWGILLGTLTSCGYTLVGASADASHARLSMSIVPFTNQTREPDLDRLTTAALQQALVQSHLFAYTDGRATAHRLQGVIRRFRSFPLALDAGDNVVQYRIEADISIRVLEAAAAQPLLEQELSTSAVYLVSRSSTDKVREDVTAREAAMTRLAQQFADQCLALLATTLL